MEVEFKHGINLVEVKSLLFCSATNCCFSVDMPSLAE